MATIVVEGLDEVMRRMDPAVLREPLRGFLDQVGKHLVEGTRDRAPVWTGRMRDSIARTIDRAAIPTWVKVETRVKTFPYPRHLDISPAMHYRSGPLEGSATRGWFSETAKRELEQIGEWARDLERELVVRMGGE